MLARRQQPPAPRVIEVAQAAQQLAMDRRLADDPVTLEQLAEEFGVSRERVRQIEVRAFEKVQKAVKNKVTAMETPGAIAAASAPKASLPAH